MIGIFVAAITSPYIGISFIPPSWMPTAIIQPNCIVSTSPTNTLTKEAAASLMSVVDGMNERIFYSKLDNEIERGSQGVGITSPYWRQIATVYRGNMDFSADAMSISLTNAVRSKDLPYRTIYGEVYNQYFGGGVHSTEFGVSSVGNQFPAFGWESNPYMSYSRFDKCLVGPMDIRTDGTAFSSSKSVGLVNWAALKNYLSEWVSHASYLEDMHTTAVNGLTSSFTMDTMESFGTAIGVDWTKYEAPKFPWNNTSENELNLGREKEMAALVAAIDTTYYAPEGMTGMVEKVHAYRSIGNDKTISASFRWDSSHDYWVADMDYSAISAPSWNTVENEQKSTNLLNRGGMTVLASSGSSTLGTIITHCQKSVMYTDQEGAPFADSNYYIGGSMSGIFQKGAAQAWVIYALNYGSGFGFTIEEVDFPTIGPEGDIVIAAAKGNQRRVYAGSLELTGPENNHVTIGATGQVLLWKSTGEFSFTGLQHPSSVFFSGGFGGGTIAPTFLDSLLWEGGTNPSTGLEYYIEDGQSDSSLFCSRNGAAINHPMHYLQSFADEALWMSEVVTNKANGVYGFDAKNNLNSIAFDITKMPLVMNYVASKGSMSYEMRFGIDIAFLFFTYGDTESRYGVEYPVVTDDYHILLNADPATFPAGTYRRDSQDPAEYEGSWGVLSTNDITDNFNIDGLVEKPSFRVNGHVSPRLATKWNFKNLKKD